jgi:hypothetical protein
MKKSFDKTINRILLLYRGLIGPIPSPEKWVFIVGCYNSGTTLLHNILASHPEIGSLPVEGQVCTDQFTSPQQLGIPRLWAIKSDQFHLNEFQQSSRVAKKLKRQWGHCFNKINRPVLIEKSITNAARIRWLNRHFQNAHFISIVRNGYAVAEGIHRKAGHDLTLAASQWAISNKVMLTDLEEVPRKIMLNYEDFTNTPEKTIEDLAKFLGIENLFEHDGKNWIIHGVTSQIQNMNHESLARLNDNDKTQIESKAFNMLKELGYCKDS